MIEIKCLAKLDFDLMWVRNEVMESVARVAINTNNGVVKSKSSSTVKAMENSEPRILGSMKNK